MNHVELKYILEGGEKVLNLNYFSPTGEKYPLKARAPNPKANSLIL